MKILVIEDKAIHQQSARDTLKGHDVTVLSSFDAAMEALAVRYDEDRRAQLLREAGLPQKPDYKERERYEAYWKLHEQLTPQVTIPFSYEVVLTDMMMPMSRETLASEAYKYGEQVPYGYVIALRAAFCGAKYVAMVTDTNHHKGAMSAALDHLGKAYYNAGFEPNFLINGAKCMFVHTPFVHVERKDVPCDECGTSGICKGCNGTTIRTDTQQKCNYCWDTPGKCSKCKGKGKRDFTEQTGAKDWGQVLKDLTAS